MDVACDRCGDAFDQPGALVFSPPGWPFGMVDKFHICSGCWPKILWHVQGRDQIIDESIVW